MALKENAQLSKGRKREKEIRRGKKGYTLELSWLQSLLLLIPPAILFAVFFAYPLFRLLPVSVFDPEFTLENYMRFFTMPVYRSTLIRTVRISAQVTVVSLLIGYPVSYYLGRCKQTASLLVFFAVLLPFWTSILVRNYAWRVLLAPGGIINSALMTMGIISEPLRLLYTEFAVILGMVHVLTPFMILPIYSVLKGLDEDLIKAARSLGASPFHVFTKIVLPLSIPGVGAGMLLVFLLSLGFYITPAVLGGPRVMMMATLIETQIGTLLNWPMAAAMSVILFLVTIILVSIFARILSLDRILGGRGLWQ